MLLVVDGKDQFLAKFVKDPESGAACRRGQGIDRRDRRRCRRDRGRRRCRLFGRRGGGLRRCGQGCFRVYRIAGNDLIPGRLQLVVVGRGEVEYKNHRIPLLKEEIDIAVLLIRGVAQGNVDTIIRLNFLLDDLMIIAKGGDKVLNKGIDKILHILVA